MQRARDLQWVGIGPEPSISLSRTPGPEPVMPSLPRLYLVDPHPTTMCTGAPVGAQAHLTEAPGAPCASGEETPILVQSRRGVPRSPGWGLERRVRRTKPPTPTLGRRARQRPARFPPLPPLQGQPTPTSPRTMLATEFSVELGPRLGKRASHAQGHTPWQPRGGGRHQAPSRSLSHTRTHP